MDIEGLIASMQDLLANELEGLNQMEQRLADHAEFGRWPREEFYRRFYSLKGRVERLQAKASGMGLKQLVGKVQRMMRDHNDLAEACGLEFGRY